MFSDYSDVKLNISKQYILREFWVKDKIAMEIIRKCFEESNNKDET